MTPTPLQKKRFYHTYIGCEVNYRGQIEVLDILNIFMILNSNFGNHPLILRSISDCTNDEKIELAKLMLMGIKESTDDVITYIDRCIEKYIEKGQKHLDRTTADYLRSIGILIPFDGLSVEQILELGWAKYKTV
jgi:hypothetical protein